MRSISFRLFGAVLLLAVINIACSTQKSATVQQPSKSRFVTERSVTSDNTLAGALFGKVVDKVTGEVLPAAHLISIDGVQASPCAETGGFTMKGVPAGLYKIKCSYPGYKPATGVVEIENARMTVVKIELVASN
jgi:hypothetical protein